MKIVVWFALCKKRKIINATTRMVYGQRISVIARPMQSEKIFKT